MKLDHPHPLQTRSPGGLHGRSHVDGYARLSRRVLRSGRRSGFAAVPRSENLCFLARVHSPAAGDAGHCNLAMLLSRHRDAEVLSYVAYHMGLNSCAARRTGRRGGLAATVGQEPAHAPGDHARRPPRAAAATGPRTGLPGSKLGIPLVAMGWLQPAVAGRELGPFCHSPTIQPSPMHPLLRSCTSRPIWIARGWNIFA